MREKVAIYCRLSEEDKNKQNATDDSGSIQNQKAMLRDYAERMGWELYGIYSDDDYAGSDRNRPEFKLTGKSRLRFAKDNVKLFRLRVGKQALELGTIAVRAGVIVVTVNAVKIPAHLARVVTKHRLLVLDAARIVGGVLLDFIFV